MEYFAFLFILRFETQCVLQLQHVSIWTCYTGLNSHSGWATAGDSAGYNL